MQGGESFAAALAEAEAAVPGEPVKSSLLELGMGESLVKDLIETAATVALPLMSPQASLRDAVRLVLRLMIPMATRAAEQKRRGRRRRPGGSGKSAAAPDSRKGGRGAPRERRLCDGHVDGRSGSISWRLEPSSHVRCRCRPRRADGSARHSRGGSPRSTSCRLAGRLPSVFSPAALLDSSLSISSMMTLPATLGAKPAAQMLRWMRRSARVRWRSPMPMKPISSGVAVQAACAFGLAPQYLLRSCRGRWPAPVDPAYLASTAAYDSIPGRLPPDR